MVKWLPIRFDEIITHSSFSTNIRGECPADILQVIKANGGYVLYVDHDCRLQRTPDKRFTLTGLYMGEVTVEWWKNKQAEKALSMLSPSVDETNTYNQIKDRQIFCYTLKNGQRLLHIQNRDNGWESYLILISHAQYADGIPSGF